MGHSEMQLAVAGLDKNALDERTRRLADGDWSGFPASDRAAFFFARKQAKTASELTARDARILTDHFGPERALDVIFWASRSHYMTRVADGFQLPLERENIFLKRGPRAGNGRPKARK